MLLGNNVMLGDLSMGEQEKRVDKEGQGSWARSQQMRPNRGLELMEEASGAHCLLLFNFEHGSLDDIATDSPDLPLAALPMAPNHPEMSTDNTVTKAEFYVLEKMIKALQQ
ncbi:hypothetical protein ACLOJK_015214 [Asimina triloba]